MKNTSRRIVVLDGHPFTGSLTSSLADTYVQSAQNAGHEVRNIKVADLSFDAILHKGYREVQELEPDLKRVQDDIVWADHITLFYPMWWGSMPALLKGFFDRVLLPGYAFSYKNKESLSWDKYLTNKTGRVVVTADAPLWYLRLWSGSSAVHTKRNILEFCGIRPVFTNEVTPVKKFSPKDIERWQKKMIDFGERGI